MRGGDEARLTAEAVELGVNYAINGGIAGPPRLMEDFVALPSEFPDNLLHVDELNRQMQVEAWGKRRRTRLLEAIWLVEAAVSKISTRWSNSCSEDVASADVGERVTRRHITIWFSLSAT